MDPLSDVLRLVRLKGSLFLNGEFREPWAVLAPSAAEMAPALAPDHDTMAICHFVLEGRCWAHLPGDAPVALEAGDAVVFPHGDAHVVGSGPGNAPPTRSYAVPVRLPELSRVRYGGDGAACVVVCGWFGFERTIADPVTASLPRLFRVRLEGRPASSWLQRSLAFVIDEAESPRAGFGVIADRVAEALFVETLRGYADSLGEGDADWLAALRDPLVGRALALMHRDPARPWTLPALARELHTSRSVLAERFSGAVGAAPMRYLTRWRMTSAASQLKGTDLHVSEIAARVGYASEAAFNRAFKKVYGAAPGAWRRK